MSGIIHTITSFEFAVGMAVGYLIATGIVVIVNTLEMVKSE